MINFVVSDIHSFYDSLKKALKDAGFNKRNKEHRLIICGDTFDRGEDALGVYNYITSIPKSRRILIKGNHDELFLKLLEKTYPDAHDFSNHTVDTFCQIAGCPFITTLGDEEQIKTEEYLQLGCYRYSEDIEHIDQDAYDEWNRIRNIVRNHEVTKWLQSDEWKDYYELDKYIFVHSFIPVNNGDGLPSYYLRDRKFSYKPDWRTNATMREWSDARWGCPWSQYRDGLFKAEEDNGKGLVCGHWHTSDFYKNLDGSDDVHYDIYYGNGIIAIDGGVWYTVKTPWERELIHFQNVLKIDDEGNIIK